MNEIAGVNTKNNRFEYFLNAVHYGIWIIKVCISKKLDMLFPKIFVPIERLIFTKRYQQKIIDGRRKYNQAIDDLFHSKMSGLCIRMADISFYTANILYFSLLSFVLSAFRLKVFGEVNKIIDFILFMFPILAGYILADRTVFYKDKYLKYFSQFEKKDKVWHRKWCFIAIVFSIGGFAAFIIGIVTMIAILGVS